MEAKKLRCGCEVKDYELIKSDGIVFIKWECVNGCETEWETVGEAPEPEDCEMNHDHCDPECEAKCGKGV